MNTIFRLLPELEGEEMEYAKNIISEMNEEDAQTFANMYRIRRREPQNVLLFSLLGILFLPGAQRFYVNQIGMGFLFLFTLGVCFVGSIIDIVNYKKLALEYNQAKAREVVSMMRTTLDSR